MDPLPDLARWKFTVPGGWVVTADGRVGITRVVARPKDNAVEIDTAFKPGQEGQSGVATEFVITGAKRVPRIVFNGEAVAAPATRVVEGNTVYAVPLPPPQ